MLQSRRPVPVQPGQLISDLGGSDAAARRDATRQLFEMGELARPALVEALGSNDLEVQRRAKYLLSLLNMGVSPESSSEQIQKLLRFRNSSPYTQRKMLNRLLAEKDYGRLLQMCSIADFELQAAWLSTNWRAHRICDGEFIRKEQLIDWETTMHPVLWQNHPRRNAMYALALDRVAEEQQKLRRWLDHTDSRSANGLEAEAVERIERVKFALEILDELTVPVANTSANSLGEFCA